MAKVAEDRIAGVAAGSRERVAAAPFDAVIAAHADALTRQLAQVGERFRLPAARRELRRFPTGEAARLGPGRMSHSLIPEF